MGRLIDDDRVIESLFDYCNGKKTLVQCIDDTPAKEAIQELEIKKKAHLIQGNTRMVDLCDLCIKAIKTKPCEDAISRSDLLQKIQEAPTHLNETWDELYDSVIDDINSMPSVIPQMKMGRWIDFNWNDGDICRWGIKCSECHTEYKHGGEMWHNPKFCPNCGSYNGGGEDADKSEV